MVWVLDSVGYDAGGGNARVFSSLEAAKAALPEVEWVERDGEWEEKHNAYGTQPIWVIYPTEIESAPLPSSSGEGEA